MLLVSTFDSHEDERVREIVSKIASTLPDKKDEYSSHITTAFSIAKEFDVNPLPTPRDHRDYFNWLSHYIESFEKLFPMSRIEHYYFLYARKVCEVLCNTELVRIYIQIINESGNEAGLNKKIEKCLKDNEFILFKLMAPAALLSSEPRQSYFNQYYKEMTEGFHDFKGIDCANLTQEEMKQLDTNASKYHSEVMNGFKKCVSMLKELNV